MIGTAGNIRGVVFDLDGTLIDSEPNYREVDVRFLRSKGIELSDEEWDEVVGMGGAPFVDFLRERHGLDADAGAFVTEKDDLYLEYARGRTKAFPISVELVRYCHVHGLALAVGTSSRRRVLHRVLEETRLARYFAASVAGDEVSRAKPHPDTFLEAARRLGVNPRACLVIEDSQHGVEAARRAGMRSVAVPATSTSGRPWFDSAELVFPGGPPNVDFAAVAGLPGMPAAARGGERGALPLVDAQTAERFRSVVWDHYAGASRSMPWRETDDAYRILVSEFMLQQTQVARVLPKYKAFIERFPTVADLASASLQDVLTLWQGLGYNRRGRNLREAARVIVERFGARVPSDVADLQSLPGVGPYTASAVAAFAYRAPVTVLETNIRRLLIHFFFPFAEAVADRELEPLLAAVLPPDRVREWYYALMDYGAMLGRLLPNANRRSASYAKQSPFAGSVREVRGRIVRALSGAPDLSIEELETSIGPTDERFEPALEGLERDGLIVVEGRRVTLR
ncbi:MAG: HAD-IA family hydrolase [Spirochaetota bacterium]